jgi:hypothetical protein
VKLYLFIVLLLPQIAGAADLRLLNTEALGKSVNESMPLLASASTNAIEPSSVQMDIAEGKFYGAILRYPESVSLEEARASINKIYKGHENPKLVYKEKMGSWRIEDKKFGIQLSKDEDNNVQVIFVKFQPVDKILEKIPKVMQKIEQEKLKDRKISKTPEGSN